MDQILIFENESWSLVSHMMEGRQGHAISVISFDKDVENDCQDSVSPTTSSPSKASTIVMSCILLAISTII